MRLDVNQIEYDLVEALRKLHAKGAILSHDERTSLLNRIRVEKMRLMRACGGMTAEYLRRWDSCQRQSAVGNKPPASDKARSAIVS